MVDGQGGQGDLLVAEEIPGPVRMVIASEARSRH